MRGIHGPPRSAPEDAGSAKSRCAQSLDLGAATWTRLLLAVSVSAAGGVTGLVYMLDSFPDSVDGHEQIESLQQDDEVASRLEEAISYDSVDVEVALYGTGDRLEFGIYKVDLPDGLTLEEYAAPAGGSRGSMLLVNLLARDFHCEASADPPICAWREGDDVVAVGGFNISLTELKPVTREVRREMRG